MHAATDHRQLETIKKSRMERVTVPFDRSHSSLSVMVLSWPFVFLLILLLDDVLLTYVHTIDPLLFDFYVGKFREHTGEDTEKHGEKKMEESSVGSLGSNSD